jgi:demethylmenaquinone methyltransferase / 2-methoxy-6-polyprenyl-1,4-benzoquinol methylase
VDLVPDMLVLAQQKAEHVGAHLPLTAGDALHLPFPDTSFDGVVTGFALRNVADIPAAFAEMARVTRPGGRVACLEFTHPRLPVFRQLFHLYFYHAVPIIGVLLTGQRTAYTYLPHSLTAFLSPEQIVAVMEDTGWQDVCYRRLMLGTVAVHVGVRAGA